MDNFYDKWKNVLRVRLNDNDLALIENYFRYLEFVTKKPIDIEPSEFVRDCMAYTIMMGLGMSQFLGSEVVKLQQKANKKFVENVRAGMSTTEQMRDMHEFLERVLLPELDKKLEESTASVKKLTGKRKAGAKKKKKRHTPGKRSREEMSL